MLKIMLSHAPGAQGDNVMVGRNDVEQIPESRAPSLLISYLYSHKFIQRQKEFCYRDWALDSGAYSAYMSGS